MSYYAVCLIVVIVFLVSQANGQQSPDGPRKIRRNAPQVFVDLADVEKLENIQQLFHTAEKCPSNPVIRPDKPWDRQGGGPAASVIYDEEEKLFKCWYQGIIGDEQISMDWTPKSPFRGFVGYGPNVLGYAVSKDGIHWDKPNLGLHEVMGTRDNNVVVPPEYHDGQDNWESVLKDPMETDPSKRYKGFGWSSKIGGLHTMTSPDGLHWTHSPNIVVPGGDAQAMMIDTLKKRYVLFVRGGSPRIVYYGTDFVHWSPRDNAGLDWSYDGEPYNHLGFVYGDTYLGVVTYFFNFPAKKFLLDVRLISSRDGLHYILPGPDPSGRDALIPVGQIGEWDRLETLLTGGPPIPVGDKLYLYYRGFSKSHDKGGQPKDTYSAGAIGLAMLRLDGFASLGAGFDGGIVTTRPIIFEGSTLSINAKADHHAYVEVEVLDEQGRPIPGYSRAECVPMTEDSVDHVIAWKNRKDLAELAGRAVKLRFHLANARLYAYRVR